MPTFLEEAPVASQQQQPDEHPHLAMYPPDEVLAHARPLPPAEEMVIEGLTDEEWDRFWAVVTEA